MAQKQYIKHLYETEGKSLREISRIMGLSFQAVKKYAYEDNWNQGHLPNVEPSHHPLLGPYIEVIDRWLEEDRRAPRKQRHTSVHKVPPRNLDMTIAFTHCLFNLLSDTNASEIRRYNLRKSNAVNERGS